MLSNTIIAKNKYGKYCVPNIRGRNAVDTIRQGYVYEEGTINLIINNCFDGDVIHAGTFFGDFLPAISKNLNKDNKIWAFEPNYNNYLCAKETCVINNLTNINLYNYGLSDEKAISNVIFRKILMKTHKR